MNDLNNQVKYYDPSNNDYSNDNYYMYKSYNNLIKDHIQDKTILELGIGHHYELINLYENAKSLSIVEASLTAISNFKQKHPAIMNNVTIINAYFEEFQTDKKFDIIAMGFVLEHVNDPLLILQKYRHYLAPGGKILAAVPNAESLHRRLGQQMGNLENIKHLSETDCNVGHKRYYTFDEFQQAILQAGYDIISSFGLFLKPLTTPQLESLEIGEKLYDALNEIGVNYPELCNASLIIASSL